MYLLRRKAVGKRKSGLYDHHTPEMNKRGGERERERERDGGSERKKERKKERNEERNEQNTTPAMFLLEELQLLYIPHACTVHITYDICTIE